MQTKQISNTDLISNNYERNGAQNEYLFFKHTSRAYNLLTTPVA